MRWGRHERHSIDGARALFLQKTHRSQSGCLLWIGAKNGSGRYGAVSIQGKQMLAHRAAYMLFIGDIPKGLQVCHTCDNGFCVEPSHLFLGSQLDNVRDMEKKKRGKHPAGENHGRAKLTEQMVNQIREWHLEGKSQRYLARYFNVARPSIKRIINGTGWLPHRIR